MEPRHPHFRKAIESNTGFEVPNCNVRSEPRPFNMKLLCPRTEWQGIKCPWDAKCAHGVLTLNQALPQALGPAEEVRARGRESQTRATPPPPPCSHCNRTLAERIWEADLGGGSGSVWEL